MEIDATNTSNPSQRTWRDFQQYMKGKCYGCGSKDHSKAQGGHERVICKYCKRVGHLDNVCSDHYMGKPKDGGLQKSSGGKQRVAASTTAEEEETLSSGSSNVPAEEQVASLKDMLESLQKQSAAQAAELKALRASGFGNGL